MEKHPGISYFTFNDDIIIYIKGNVLNVPAKKKNQQKKLFTLISCENGNHAIIGLTRVRNLHLLSIQRQGIILLRVQCASSCDN